ncbi:PREDICTED: Golgi-associated PDZ and coiled-coil motif-containing protein-like [Papilio xuthus]|uniref:Golgi-associated PDZ and coiled-coil motif-containing protein-like n=1 Tax=Papilio xuthus TaxID=66420 RepID=A0AAJ6ZQZ3_PAPXU|nr:PREDICTED: Golgi-associated PDZ and coiled-coil motif-containing protein-like [Papilio xuthus]
MATTGVGFRWLDILEKEFDKACVELDTSVADLETEEPDVAFAARQKIATLSSCFAQLTHKALTIFQNSAKLEAELVDMRAELVQARAAVAARKDSVEGMAVGIGEVGEARRARAEAAQLARENAALRDTVLALHSELFGARLATKYLDKELAGRIQQLQLLGRDMRSEVRDSLWAQVEAEILLQRHKTLVRVCRGLSPRPPRPRAPAARPRTVRVRRSPHLGLGISVTGGREHGVPILISELEAGGPAALTGELYVGDAILAINDLDLTQACHKEAVQALQSVKGDCALCVQFIATDDDDRLSEDNYRFPLYPEDGEVFCEEGDGSGATPTAPRTPDYNNRAESVAGSGSECGSERCGAVRGARRADYAVDYSALNNNLAILDMDDDNIKIETRLEMVRLESENVGERRRGPYQAVSGASPGVSPPSSPPRVRASRTASSPPPATPLSTPVHTRRPSLKKRRKPQDYIQDWRTKGTYRAVAGDAHSSDEPHVTAEPRHSTPRR